MGTGTGSIDLSTLNNLHTNLTQHFWFNSDAGAAYGTGVHMTLSSQAEFIANPTGQNILMNTDGISIRNGTIPLMVLDNDSLDFNVITDLAQGTYSNVATFGATGFRMGAIADGETRLVANGVGVDLIRREGTSDTTLVHFGYDYGTPEQSGQPQVQNPYYTLGYRSPNYNVGNWSVAEGYWTVASGFASYAEGRLTVASGAYSHAEGFDTVASGHISHAEGYDTVASDTNSHAEGRNTEASGFVSHAEGYHTVASDYAAHAEGYYTIAHDTCHAEGCYTVASNINSHAEGQRTCAEGYASHVAGIFTKTKKAAQTAIGTFNVVDESTDKVHHDTYLDEDDDDIDITGEQFGKYAFIIGNGNSEDDRSNAFAVDWDGNVKAKGNFYANCASDSSGTAHIGEVFNWQGSLNRNLTANADAYVAGGSITLPAGHTYIVIAYLSLTNSTSGTNARRVQIYNTTAGASVMTQSVTVAHEWWGTVQAITTFQTTGNTTLQVRGSSSRPTTTIPTAWIRAICIT